MYRRTFVSALSTSAVGAGLLGTSTGVLAASTIDELMFDSTASLLNANSQPLTDDSLVAVWAEPTAYNDDAEGTADDAVPYPDGTPIPLVAVDGNVVGLGNPIAQNDTDFRYGNEEFFLNLWDAKLGGSGTVLWDEGHGQFYGLGEFASFETYAEENGYTVEATSDLTADLSAADGVVITTPGGDATFGDSLLNSLSTFVSNGGAVFLLSQSDFSNYDATATSNNVAEALGAGFRFNDDQVFDDTNNTGVSYTVTSANFNTDSFASLFEPREGIASQLDPTQTYTVDVMEVTDGDTVNVQFPDGLVESVRVLGVDTPETAVAADAERPAEWEGLGDRVGLYEAQFGSTASLLSESKAPLTDDSLVVAWAEDTATNEDADGNGDAVVYEDEPIPLAAIDGNVVGVGTPFVADGALNNVGYLDNEELLLNVWDDQLGGSGTVLWDESHTDSALSGFSVFEGYAESNGYTVEATIDVTADLSGADGLVVPPLSEGYTDAELTAITEFAGDGGSVFVHAASDFDDPSTTALNTLVAALGAGFRFNDDQVVDSESNAGAPYYPTTTRFNPEFDVFRERQGVDRELYSRTEGEPVESIQFVEGTTGLLDGSKQPSLDDSLVPVRAEPSATISDGDAGGDEGAAISYPDGTSIPLVAVDGNVAGFGSTLVTGDLPAEADNEEFLLNVWDSQLGGSGTVWWDDSHGQYAGSDAASAFVDLAEINGYTVESGSSIPSDASEVDGLVVTTPAGDDLFTDSEIDSLASFVDDGGSLFLHSQDDYNNYDTTTNLNSIASGLSLGFRFNDGQVLDESNNLGQPFSPTTTNLNTADFSLFTARQGFDDVQSGYWENAYPYLSYWGDEASSFAAEKLAGETVELSFDPAGSQFNDGVRDPFGRVLGYIHYDDGSGSRDAFYNRQLLAQGYARSYGSSLSRLESLLGAELDARANGDGLWRQSNPDISPTVRNGSYTELFVPQAVGVTTTSGSLSTEQVPVAAGSSASPSNAPLVAVDSANNVGVVGGLLVDEGYTQAEGFAVDTSGYGNEAFLTNLIDSLSATNRSGPVLFEGGHGQFNADYGLSSEDVAHYQRFLEGVDIGLEGINDVTASRLSDARGVVVTTPMTTLSDAEISALSSFAAGGGAVVLMGAANAPDDAIGHLNAVAGGIGSDLRLSANAVTDSSANVNGNASLPITANFAAGSFSLFGPYDPDAASTPTLSVTFPDGAMTGVDGTVTAAIELSHVPEGLAGYRLTASVGDTEVATIEGASYSVLGTTQAPAVADDGSSVELKASDTGDAVQAGATDVELGRIDLAGHASGTTALSLNVAAFDADGGAAISPTTVAGTLESRGIEAVDGDTLPTDPDDDGVYEDLNGNGEIDTDDVVLLFQHKEEAVITDHVEAYDLNGNGRIDFDDVNELFDEA